MKRSARILAILAIIALVAPAAGCAPKPPSDAPTIPNGTVASLTPGPQGGTMLVESTDPATSFDKAMVSVTDDTTVLRETGSGYERSGFDSLTVGARVDVWITGPVAESYPVQAGADVVVIRR